MSSDRTAEILNYLSAISREFGEFRREMSDFRAEVNARFEEVNAKLAEFNTRLERIEREQRLQGRRLDRIEGLLLVTRSDVAELQDRVSALEGEES